MVERAEGFGGVVFGSPVSDDNLPALKSLRWQHNSKTPGWGTLHCTFGDGVDRVMGPVSLDDAWAAWKIVFSPVPQASAWEPGHGIGLVGIDNQVGYFDCGPHGLIHEGRRWRVVMHPAIAELNLGWSVLMCDALPLEELQPGLLQSVRAGGDAKLGEKIRQQWSKSMATWKFVDVPTVIRLDPLQGSRVYVEPRLNSHSVPVVSHGTDAFFTMQAFDEAGNVLPKFAEQFYPLVPALVRASRDYQRLNDFAQVLSIYRWAKSRGASCDPLNDAPPRVDTPASIVTTAGGVASAPPFTVSDAVRQQTEKSQMRLAALYHSGNSLSRLALDGYTESKAYSDSLRKRLERSEADTDTLLQPQLQDAPASVQQHYNELLSLGRAQMAVQRFAVPDSEAWAGALKAKADADREILALIDESFPNVAAKLDAERAKLMDAERAATRAANLAKAVFTDFDYWRELRQMTRQE
jgi:hypothetical protein